MHFDSSSSSGTGWKITSFSSDEMNNKDKAVSPLVGSKRYMVATSDSEEVYRWRLYGSQIFNFRNIYSTLCWFR